MNRIVPAGAAVLLLSAAGLAWLYCHGPGSDDSHRTNRQSNLWKEGKAPYDPSVVLRFINVDFVNSLKGKSRAEMEKWFPDLRSPGEANEYQRYYSESVSGMDYLWIGDSAWGIEFDSGRVKELHLLKG